MKYLVNYESLLEANLFLDIDLRVIVSNIWERTKSPIAREIIDLIGKDIDINFNYIKMAKVDGYVSFLQDDKIKEKVYKLHKDFFDNGAVLNQKNIQGYAYDLSGNIIENTNELLKDVKNSRMDIDIENDRFYIELEFNYGFSSVRQDYRMVVVKRISDSSKYILFWEKQSGNGLDIVLPDMKYNDMRIGKMIRNILNSVNFKYNDKDIEEFVEDFNISYKEASTDLEIVSGEEIRYWYYVNNYSSQHSGSLGNSCMKYKSCQDYLDIYVENPDVCQMAIYRDENNKLLGRALLWTDIDGKKYMDVAYTSRNYLSRIFYTWGKKNGYDRITNQEIEVKVKPSRYEKYPYFDNLCHYYPESGILSNLIRIDDDNGDELYRLELCETDGSYVAIKN